jgi:hypothetical protein
MAHGRRMCIPSPSERVSNHILGASSCFRSSYWAPPKGAASSVPVLMSRTSPSIWRPPLQRRAAHSAATIRSSDGGVEQRPRERSCEPVKDDQAADVRPGGVRVAAGAGAQRRLMEKSGDGAAGTCAADTLESAGEPAAQSLRRGMARPDRRPAQWPRANREVCSAGSDDYAEPQAGHDRLCTRRSIVGGDPGRGRVGRPPVGDRGGATPPEEVPGQDAAGDCDEKLGGA